MQLVKVYAFAFGIYLQSTCNYICGFEMSLCLHIRFKHTSPPALQIDSLPPGNLVTRLQRTEIALRRATAKDVIDSIVSNDAKKFWQNNFGEQLSVSPDLLKVYLNYSCIIEKVLQLILLFSLCLACI